MTNPTISKLYSFIAKLICLLEEELDELCAKQTKSAINVKKNITDTLNKLVILIIQLNKLGKEEDESAKVEMPNTDKEIIESFLEKYTKDEHK